jgi:ABC-type transport system substrate-binding protein
MKLSLSRNILAFLVCGAALIPACTKKKPESETSSESGSGKKIFYHYRTSEEKTLDPHKQFDAASALLVRSIYDTLMEYHYLKRPYSLEPALLEKMPEKKEASTYLFTLKKGVKFHDNPAFPDGKGRELTVDDIIFSLKRFADGNVNDRSYSLIAGRIIGMDAFREQSKKLGKDFDYDKVDIPGIKKVDSHTFTIQFANESPLNLYPFAASSMSIVAREAVQKYGQDFDKNPVGTGPFSMKSYSRRGTVVLAKNPNYWQSYPAEGEEADKAKGLLAAAGKKLPLVDEIQLPLIEEPQPAMLKFKKKDIHWVAINRDDFQAMVDRTEDKQFKLKPEFAKDFELYAAPSLSSTYLKMSFQDPLVGKNKALRQALAAAIDYEGYINLMLNGRGFSSQSLVPVEIAGSVRDTNSVGHKTDIELAKKKLAEAGFPEGKGLPELTIEYRNSDKNTRQLFEYVRNDLAKVGIKVKGNFQTFSNFLQKTESGNFQLADAGWNADYPDPENFYANLYGPNKAPLPNDGNFQNARYDELYLKMKDMPNGPERYKIIAEMDAIIKEEVPYVLLYNQILVGLLQKNVQNFKRHMMDEYPYKFLDLAGK